MVMIAVLLLGTSVMTGPCPVEDPVFRIPILRAAREVYLDPSPPSRIRQSTLLIKTVLDPLKEPRVLGRPGVGECVGSYVLRLLQIGDEHVMVEALNREADAFEALRVSAPANSRLAVEAAEARRSLIGSFSTHEPQQPVRMRVNQAIAACTGEVPGASCDRDTARVVALSGDPRAQEILKHPLELHRHSGDGIFFQVSYTWAQLYDQHPSRLDFIASVVNPSGPDESSSGWHTNAMLRKMALDEFLPTDPREWDPGIVAMLVKLARNADAADVAATKREHSRQTHPYYTLYGAYGTYVPCGFAMDWPPPESADVCLEEQILQRLERMGLQRAWSLIDPRTFAQGPPRWDHFEGEADLYKAEAGRVGRSPEDQWLETDQAAPTPDLTLVKAALDAIERRTKTPSDRTDLPVPGFDLTPPPIDRQKTPNDPREPTPPGPREKATPPEVIVNVPER